MATKETKEMLEALERQEKKSGPSGAVPRTPKQNLLNDPINELAGKNPDKAYRWVNIKDANKVHSRRADGYERLAESDGGKQLGDELAIFSIPKSKREERVAQLEQINEARLGSHQAEMYRAVEQVAKELRDRHGVRVNTDRLFVNE